MKQLLFLICVALVFSSCSVMKKATNKQQSHVDTSGTKSLVLVDVKKEDTTKTSTVTEAEKKSSDSTYKKTTVIREYYTDEFDFGDDDTTQVNPNDQIKKTPINPEDYLPPFCCDKPIGKASDKSPDNSTGKKTNQVTAKKKPVTQLLYREIEITEEGKLVKLDNKELKKEETAAGVTVGIHGKEENETSHVVKDETAVQSSTFRRRVLPGIGISLFLLIIIYVCWRLYKKKISIIQ